MSDEKQIRPRGRPPAPGLQPEGNRSLSPLGRLPKVRRLARVLGVLEAALMGRPVPGWQLAAAKDWLKHYRWEREMKEGPPRNATSAEQPAEVNVINSIASPAEKPSPGSDN